MQHYKGTTGYAALYLVMFFGISVLTLLLASLCSALGLQGAVKVAGGVILAAFWVCGFVVAQRFVIIEKRLPTISESNIVGIKSVLYIFVPIICLALIGALVGFVVSLFGSDGGASEAGKTAQSAGNAEQSQQAMGALLGVFSVMLLLYLAPFVNLVVISRLFAPKAEVV